MKNQDEFAVQDIAAIQKHIISIRNVHAILDRDLAVMYDVEVKHLNRQVKRNIERFPADFMFQLTKEECTRCQIGTLYERGEKALNWSTYRPYAFTENGVAMLSGVLRSPIAVAVNIGIMRAFTAMRCFVSDLSVAYSDDFHDRFLIIDNAELHGLGSSINRLGRRITSYTTRDPKEIAKLLATIRKI